MQLILMYIVRAIALLLLGGGVAWKITSDYSEVKFNNYKSEVEQAGYKQQAKNWQEKLDRDNITQELERTNAATKVDLDNKYAAYRRLLNTKSRSGSMPSVPLPASDRACREDETVSSARMDEFEGRVLDILERGDKAISSAITYEDWLDSQSTLKNNSQ